MSKTVKETKGQTHFKEVFFKCPMCGKTHSMLLDEESALRYIIESDKGIHIQDIFPDMSPRDREKFITGYCDNCQKKLFGGF